MKNRNNNFLLTGSITQRTGCPKRKLDPGVCAVCNNRILVQDNDEAIVERTYKLGCDHVYPFPIKKSSFFDWH